MAYFTPKRLARSLALTFGASLLLAYALQKTAIYGRKFLCLATRCNYSIDTAESVGNPPPSVESCITRAYLLSRNETRRVRDTILLLGSEDSVAEYLLPFLHLSSYDKSLVDTNYERKGLSGAKYGYPFSIPNQHIRYLLFKLHLADAIVITPTENSPSIHPDEIKYLFRLQPFKLRRSLPMIPHSLGVSEDSEVLGQLVSKNPHLFKGTAFTCP